MLDKRLFSRFKIHCNCSLALEDKFQVFDAALEDISLGGLRISTFTPLNVGQRLYFTISIKPPIKGVARVVWIQKNTDRYTAGLEIVEMKEKFKHNLQELINELTLKTLSSAYFR